MKKTTKGFAIRTKGKSPSYYDMNGLGDWSLAGDVETCSIFKTVEDAIGTLDDEIAGTLEGYSYECVIVPITRTVEVMVGKPVTLPEDDDL